MYLLTSDIGLAPLPDNLFTRGKCGFKILQYAAAGLPMVVSPVGVNAEYVNDGVNGFHAADTQQWVERISKLIENRQLREQMGQAAREGVGRFDAGIMGRRLISFLIQAING
jgi:glycosyltransferase involved in cell wall biosynthesis